MTFAMAEPSMPSPTPWTRTGERPMLKRLATPRAASGVRVSWKPRIQPWAGGRHEHERRAEGGDAHPDQRLVVGGRRAAREQLQRRPRRELDADHQRPVPARRRATWPARRRRARRPSPPGAEQPRRRGPSSRTPGRSEAEDLGQAAGRPSASPARGTVPRWPTMAVSPSTYSGSATSAPRAGRARRTISRSRGAVGAASGHGGSVTSVRCPDARSSRPGAWSYGACAAGSCFAAIRPQGRPRGTGRSRRASSNRASSRCRRPCARCTRRPASTRAPVARLDDAALRLHARRLRRVFKVVACWLMRPRAGGSGRSTRRCASRSPTRLAPARGRPAPARLPRRADLGGHAVGRARRSV